LYNVEPESDLEKNEKGHSTAASQMKKPKKEKKTREIK